MAHSVKKTNVAQQRVVFVHKQVIMLSVNYYMEELSRDGMFRGGIIAEYSAWDRGRGEPLTKYVWISADQYATHEIHEYHDLDPLSCFEIYALSWTSWREILAQAPPRLEVMTTPDGDGHNPLCSICHEDMEWAHETECGHLFHTRCIGIWAGRTQRHQRPPSCPLCRRRISTHIL